MKHVPGDDQIIEFLDEKLSPATFFGGSPIVLDVDLPVISEVYSKVLKEMHRNSSGSSIYEVDKTYGALSLLGDQPNSEKIGHEPEQYGHFPFSNILGKICHVKCRNSAANVWRPQITGWGRRCGGERRHRLRISDAGKAQTSKWHSLKHIPLLKIQCVLQRVPFKSAQRRSPCIIPESFSFQLSSAQSISLKSVSFSISFSFSVSVSLSVSVPIAAG
mmetsp:Transcript_5213/g.8978  ORF Transcript_5213/g.8978 Transcript_5213/m.8978 type:complete len:218 (+) Transcript_5213:406-1059(+)